MVAFKNLSYFFSVVQRKMTDDDDGSQREKSRQSINNKTMANANAKKLFIPDPVNDFFMTWNKL